MKTIGDHLRTKRLDSGLLQNQVARQIGVTESTIYNWESNATTPIFRYYQPIVQFLGYNPFPEPQTLAERLVRYRKVRGLSQSQFARRLGVDPSTLGKWETGERVPTSKFSAVIEQLHFRVEQCGSG